MFIPSIKLSIKIKWVRFGKMDINDAWVIGRNDDNYDSFCPFLKLNEAEK